MKYARLSPITPPNCSPHVSATNTSPFCNMSMTVWWFSRTGVFALQAAESTSAMSGRVGIICSVTARPISFFSECKICQPASHWLRYPCWLSPSASSADMSFSFASSASGTLGRPSGNRSNGFCAVYASI